MAEKWVGHTVQNSGNTNDENKGRFKYIGTTFPRPHFLGAARISSLSDSDIVIWSTS